ncbi:MAG: hypothetical protein IPP74_14795 [Alphaproteobacteria bacterium]|nr:hypothetical protein [Alphaproteobacteria bacterium]
MRYLLAILLLAQVSVAQENRGVSWILQMCSEHTDCSAIEAAYRGVPVINAGWMYLTSNPNRCKCAPRLLEDSRQKNIRIDICNSTCFPERGRSCQPAECFAGQRQGEAGKKILANDPATYKRIDRSIAMAQANLLSAKGPLKLFVKSCLECSIDPAARKKLNAYVAAKFSSYPGVEFVDNPINDRCQPGMVCEKHGSPVGNNNLIADNDGLDYDGIDQLSYWRKNKPSRLVLAWKGCNNGLAKGETFKPGQNRTNYCSASRDGKDFNSATISNAVDKPTEAVDPLDLKGCRKMLKAPDGPQKFVLKLSEGRAHSVWLSPPALSGKTFKKVELLNHGKRIDGSRAGVPGYRYGVPYLPDTTNPKRRLYDFMGHPRSYPDNSVLHADGFCWILEKPRFRVD